MICKAAKLLFPLRNWKLNIFCDYPEYNWVIGLSILWGSCESFCIIDEEMGGKTVDPNLERF